MSKHKQRLTGLAGIAAVAASAGALLLGATAAHAAASTPPWETGNSAAAGTLTFYDTNGNVVTSGRSDVAPFSAYAVGSNALRSSDVQAGLIYAAPDPNKTPASFPKAGVGAFTQYPISSGPSTDPSYAGIVQIRMRSADSNGQQSQTYLTADLKVDSTTHTWTQVYPAPKTATTTTLSANPSPATAGDSVTLTAAESPAVAGSVQFQDGSTPLGGPVAVNGSGVATTTTTSLAQGSHTLSAVFTPTDTTTNSGSTGTTTLTVNPAATKTTTSLAVTQDGTAGDPATLAATVKESASGNAVSAGKVDFYDNGSGSSLGTVPGSAAVNGVYTLTLPNGFAAGPHSIVAKFTPTDVTQSAASQSGPQAFTTQPPATGACAAAGSSCTDTQNVQVTVGSGTLVINTPYTASNPLDLGTLAPNSTGTELTASKQFQNIVITDSRNGSSGYTVSAQSSNLSDGKSNAGSTISSQNVGLTGLTSTTSAGFTGTVTPHDNPAAEPAVAPGAAGTQGLGNAAHPVLGVTGNSRGTVTANGTLTINAPTSTEQGLFTGTITFTVG